MGIVQQRVSDVSGALLPDNEAVTVTIKGHPAVNGDAKVLDASAAELATLKKVEGLLELDIKDAAGNTTTAFCTRAEFAKIVSDDKVKALPSNRGRRPGFSPGNGHNGG